MSNKNVKMRDAEEGAIEYIFHLYRC